ncbi:MAG: ABC transporter ATP-binding protein, partial [Pirellulales bacterium]
MQLRRSRLRFAEYRQQLRDKRRNGQPHEPGAESGRRGRPRSFWRLFVAFWGMLAGHRAGVVFGLVTLTVATLLALVPPAATKLVIDNVLDGQP